jgi:hypothetical protein
MRDCDKLKVERLNVSAIKPFPKVEVKKHDNDASKLTKFIHQLK